MVRRLGLGKNNHLTYASLALNPRYDMLVCQLDLSCWYLGNVGLPVWVFVVGIWELLVLPAYIFVVDIWEILVVSLEFCC